MPVLKLTTFRKLLVILLVCLFNIANAQTDINTTFSDRMNYIFQQLEKNRVPNGLLLDYAFDFTEPNINNGAEL